MLSIHSDHESGILSLTRGVVNKLSKKVVYMGFSLNTKQIATSQTIIMCDQVGFAPEAKKCLFRGCHSG